MDLTIGNTYDVTFRSKKKVMRMTAVFIGKDLFGNTNWSLRPLAGTTPIPLENVEKATPAKSKEVRLPR